MYCSCQKPHKIVSEANGVKFHVCSKQLGGCGDEILTQEMEDALVEACKQNAANFGAHPGTQGNRVLPYIKADGRPGFAVNVVMEVCPECEGGGMTAKLYPNGHTEITCERCNGAGEVEAYD